MVLPIFIKLIQFNMNILIDNLETIQDEQTISDDDEESRIYSGQVNDWIKLF